MPTLGDLIFYASSSWDKLSGNTTTGTKFLSSTGDGDDSAAPAWSTLTIGDVADLEDELDGKADADTEIPSGGTEGQLLAKASGTNYDTEWVDAPEGGGGGGWTLIDSKTSNGSNGTLTLNLSGSYSSLLIVGSVWAGSGGTEVRMTVNGSSSTGNYGEHYYYAEGSSPVGVAWDNWGYVVVSKQGANYNYPTVFTVEYPLYGAMVPSLGGAFARGMFRFSGWDTSNTTSHGWGAFHTPVPSTTLTFTQTSGVFGGNSTISVYGM